MHVCKQTPNHTEMEELKLAARVAGVAWALLVAYTYFDGSVWSYHPLILGIGFGILMVARAICLNFRDPSPQCHRP